MTKVAIHQTICEELNKLYERKNHDYGDSFGKSYDEYGMAMPCIRLEDKLNRLKALTRNGDQQVADESIEDTLLDLANYAIMTVVERRKAYAID
jgi:rRNA-processing protein FCF1